MNWFVDVLNRIRQSAEPAWLTPSQRRAYEALLERLKFLDEVNLWGGPGTGKTFLGWMFYKQRLTDYVSAVEWLGQAGPLRAVVVDNAGWKRREVRDVLHLARQSGYDRVVLITREPVQEQMATVELPLTPEDIEQAIANLRRIRVSPCTDAPKTLWELVSPIPLSPRYGGTK